MVEEGSKRIRTAGAIMPNASFGPTSIVNRVIRLHRGNHMQLGEPIKVFRRHMLRMLNTPAPIAAPVRLLDIGINIEDRRNPGVSNGVRANLQPGFVRLHHAVVHKRNRMHFVGKNAATIRLIAKGLKEISCRGTKRTIRKRFDCANPQVRTAEGTMDSNLHLIVNLRDERCCVDARCQLALIEQFVVDRDIGIVRIHVLDAGHPERCRMLQCALYRVTALRMRERWDGLKQQILRSIFQTACRIPLRITNNDSTRRVRGLRGDSRQLQRQRVRQRPCARHIDSPPPEYRL